MSLSNEELEDIIHKLESHNSKNDAYWGIFEMDVHQNYIKANHQGLELFAARLLKHSQTIKEKTEYIENEYIDFGLEEKWVDEDSILITSLHPVLKQPENKIEEEAPSTILDILIPIIIIAILILLFLSCIIGFGTIIGWVINLFKG